MGKKSLKQPEHNRRSHTSFKQTYKHIEVQMLKMLLNKLFYYTSYGLDELTKGSISHTLSFFLYHHF